MDVNLLELHAAKISSDQLSIKGLTKFAQDFDRFDRCQTTDCSRDRAEDRKFPFPCGRVVGYETPQTGSFSRCDGGELEFQIVHGTFHQILLLCHRRAVHQKTFFEAWRAINDQVRPGDESGHILCVDVFSDRLDFQAGIEFQEAFFCGFYPWSAEGVMRH